MRPAHRVWISILTIVLAAPLAPAGEIVTIDGASSTYDEEEGSAMQVICYRIP